ncbi:hypothetical protein DPEC_G00124740 [Dallia pectoralis]|uniref:Uncharacterized protein n=1 Tax=Dallia pectoralis TaxID=75939 RepID=A0ACC2GR12_DALPE|nr:hypothetical protein DPEC_G00124740 [Dallia pectoralis]
MTISLTGGRVDCELLEHAGPSFQSTHESLCRDAPEINGFPVPGRTTPLCGSLEGQPGQDRRPPHWGGDRKTWHPLLSGGAVTGPKVGLGQATSLWAHCGWADAGTPAGSLSGRKSTTK